MSSATDTAGHRASALNSWSQPAHCLPCDAQTKPHSIAKTNTRDHVAGALQVVASLLWIPQAALIAVAVGGMPHATDINRVLWLAAAVLMIGLLRASLDAAGGRMAFLSARQTLSAARMRAADAVSRRSPLDTKRAASGRAGSVLAEQAEMIVPYRARYHAAQLSVAVVPPLILLCILTFSWAAAVVLLIAAPLIPLFMVLIGWRAKDASEKQLVETGGMNAFLLDRLRGLTTIRTFDAVDATAKRLRADAENLRVRTMAVLRIAFLSSAVLELFAALGVAMVAVYVGFHLLGQLPFGAWGTPLSLSEGLFILLLAPAFFEPLRDLSAVWHDRAAGRAAEAELDSLTEGGIRIVGALGSAQAGGFGPHAPGVCIQNVTFRHAAGTTDAIRDLNLTVRPGEHVAILGPSGSGKSTLLALVAGLAPATSGHISIGGLSLCEETAADLRARMAWIGQRPHIFAGTLAGNVSLGRVRVTRDDIAGALQFARLDAVARARGPAVIGENGQGLSGGEALRLALARIAVDPRAGLILADEPTAHLDDRTARDIVDGLKALARNKTLIIATHDPVLAASMDRIVQVRDLGVKEAA